MPTLGSNLQVAETSNLRTQTNPAQILGGGALPLPVLHFLHELHCRSSVLPELTQR